MAFCPFAVQQIIPESRTQGKIKPTTIIYHRAVSSAESLLGYWTTPGVELESHFYIGQHGTIYQFMDTEVRADANVDANGFAISIETWDGGNTPDSMGWNDKQVASAKKLGDWLCTTHGIKRAAATTWNGGGIGGHNWFPGPWAGGPRGCPGTERNRQLRQDIIPAIAGGTIIEEDDDVSFKDITVNKWGGKVTFETIMQELDYRAWEQGEQLKTLTALVGELAKDPALTPERAAEIVRDAVSTANATNLAAQKALLENTLAVVREIISARDVDLADEVVEALADRLRGEVAAE